MKNQWYLKTIYEDHNIKHLTMMDFIEACDLLKLPVFEVRITLNPYQEPQRVVKPNMYENMSAYRKTMPAWSATDEYPDIEEGEFEVRSVNNSSDYHWHFEVSFNCVVVHFEEKLKAPQNIHIVS